MNRRGYEKISAAIEGIAGKPKVLPYPELNQDVPYLAIKESWFPMNPAIILNRLDKAGLLKRDGLDKQGTSSPRLKYIDHIVNAKSGLTHLVFEDTNSSEKQEDEIDREELLESLANITTENNKV
jgi:hypothetical protein